MSTLAAINKSRRKIAGSKKRRFLDLFLDIANRQPNSVFCHLYSRPDACQSLTFSKLARDSSARGKILKDRMDPGSIAFILSNSVEEQLRWWLAALWAGAVPGILTPPTPKLNRDRYLSELAAILKKYKHTELILDPELSEGLQPVVGKRGIPTNIRAGNVAASSISQPTERAPDQPFIFQQSSGTTGLRKGILFSENAVINQLNAYGQNIRLNSQDVIVSWLPLYHDMGLVACLMQSLYFGIPIAITSPFTWLAHPDWLFEAIERHHGTLSWLPNFALNVLSRRVSPDKFRRSTLASLRLLVNCSEPVQSSSINLFQDRFKDIGLDPKAMSSSYAMAENTFAVTQSPPGQGVVLEQNGRLIASSGQALPTVDLRIVDETGKSVREGHTGEIRIRSDSLLLEYFGIGEQENPIDSDGWLSTGDTGYLRNRELFVIGRKKDLIIRGGAKYHPGDIESVVSELPAVKDGRVVAFGMDNAEEGTEDIAVLAEFTGDKVSDVDDIVGQIRESISNSLGISPQRVELLRQGWLVKSSSGKISRNQCREKYVSLLKNRERPQVFVSSYADNLDEQDKDAFAFFGESAKIRTPTEIACPGLIKIGNWASLGRYGKILMPRDFSHLKTYIRQHYPAAAHDLDDRIYSSRSPRLKIGDGASIGDDFLIACVNSIEIGRHVLISSRVFITDSHHLYDRPDLPISFQGNTPGTPVVIGDHSWIGINCCIMEGVTIGKHAVVTANSVVIRDVPNYAVVAGNPARIVKIISGQKPGKSKAAAQLSKNRKVGRRESEWTSRLIKFFHSTFNIALKPDDSLFSSGRIDSLSTLQLLQFIETSLGIQVNEPDFFENPPDTVSDLARYMVSHQAK